MARLEIPDGPGGEAAMIWSLRPPLGGMVERMIKGAYQQSILPAEERELARMRIAQLELYDHVAEFATYPGYTARQRLAIEV
jgi:hypothetical protein